MSLAAFYRHFQTIMTPINIKSVYACSGLAGCLSSSRAMRQQLLLPLIMKAHHNLAAIMFVSMAYLGAGCREVQITCQRE